MKNAASPPCLARWLLDRLSGWGDDYGAAGDFEGIFQALAAERGARHARRACWKQVAAAPSEWPVSSSSCSSSSTSAVMTVFTSTPAISIVFK